MPNAAVNYASDAYNVSVTAGDKLTAEQINKVIETLLRVTDYQGLNMVNIGDIIHTPSIDTMI